MYKFTEDCMIHIDTIDNEHRHLFEIINNAILSIQNSENITTLVRDIIEDLKSYATIHFAHEESYMERINDPELPLQKKEHAAFTAEINSFSIEGLSNDEARVALQDLLTYLVRWLYKHILSSDIMIGQMCKPQQEDPYAFTDKYKTGITIIDDEHRYLFAIIKDIDDVIHDNLLHDKYDEIMRLLNNLKDYTESHFQHEEHFMEEIHYPGIEAQQYAHAAFVDHLVNIHLDELDEIDDNQDNYLITLIDFLLKWLSNHILGMDKKIGEFVKNNNN